MVAGSNSSKLRTNFLILAHMIVFSELYAGCYMKCKDKIKPTQNNRKLYISRKTAVYVQEMEMEVTNYTALLLNVTYENTTELQSYHVKESDIISFITIGKYNIPIFRCFSLQHEICW